MRRIAFMAEKGGTGKTTTAINVASGMARAGHRVVVVDLDPQGNATLVFLRGIAPEAPTISAVLLDEAEAVAAIRPTGMHGLEILPAQGDLADANLALANQVGRETRLRVALDSIEDLYDVAIVDTSPQRSILTVNALVAVEEVIVPIDPGLFALSGLGQLQTTVDQVRRFLDNPRLRIAGLVLTRTRNDNVTKDVEAQLRETFGELVYQATIPTNAKIEEAHSRYQSVLDYSPRSAGAVAYGNLTAEIIRHGRTKDRTRPGVDKSAQADHAA